MSIATATVEVLTTEVRILMVVRSWVDQQPPTMGEIGNEGRNLYEEWYAAQERFKELPLIVLAGLT